MRLEQRGRFAVGGMPRVMVGAHRVIEYRERASTREEGAAPPQQATPRS